MRLYRTEGAREFTLEVVDAGTVFGETAFTPYRLRESYARATAPSVVFAMERAEVEPLQIRRRFIYVDDVEALQRAAGRLLLEEAGESAS